MLGGFWGEATPSQRSAFLAAWLGWILDAFDFTIFLLVMPQIGKEMALSREQLGWVVTATLLGRFVGGPLGGWLCDRFGRRRPMMASLVLYALFDFWIVFATSYPQLLLLRFLFGVGMGAEWSAGTALAMEHWPVKTRGWASGVLQGSWAIGYFFAALGYRWLVPSFGWRSLFFLAAVPALLAIFVRARVEESPSWLAESAQPEAKARGPGVGQLLRERPLRLAALVGSLVLCGGFFTYYALATFYPTLMQARGLSPDRVATLVILFNAGMLGGCVTCGGLSERIGRRGAIALYAGGTIPVAALYLLSTSTPWIEIGAFLGGFVGVGWTGATPSYLAEQFPTHLRGAGVGLAYHAGALVGALAPLVVPGLEQLGLPLDQAMTISACAGGAVTAGAVWLRPERRGAQL